MSAIVPPPGLGVLVSDIDDLLACYIRLQSRRTGSTSILSNYSAKLMAVRSSATPEIEAFIVNVRASKMLGLGLAQCHDQMNCGRPVLGPLQRLEVSLMKDSISSRRCKKHFRQAPKRLARGKKKNFAAPTALGSPTPISDLLDLLEPREVLDSSQHLVVTHGKRATAALARKPAKRRKKMLERDVRVLEACLFLVKDAESANQNVCPFSHAIATYLAMGR